jgi:SAM-dependent methyltransferase
MTFHDHFSDRAAAYARYRPTYPPELFTWLAEVAPGTTLAWDCGTGNGQAAIGLANHFSSVLATDPSTEQLAVAAPRAGITYQRALEADSGLPHSAVDLVTAAQALHWFDLPAFYTEVERVLRPAGVLAVWCYGLHRVATAIDGIFERFYGETVGPYWPPERRHVETGYRELEFPWPDLPVPQFAMQAELDLERLVAYVGTWSAVKGYREATGVDPIPNLRRELDPAWGDAARPRLVRWPLSVRAGRALKG